MYRCDYYVIMIEPVIRLRIFVFCLLLIIVISSITGLNIYYASPNNYVQITFHIVLLDNRPLPNATITVISSSDIMHTYIGKTNRTGTCVIRVPRPLSGSLRLDLTIKYNIYGAIYSRQKVIDLEEAKNNYLLEIKLPYTTLYKTIKITDEYGDKLSGNLILFYNNIIVYNTSFNNGLALIDGNRTSRLLLWSSNKVFQDKYNLQIKTDNMSRSFKGIPSNVYIDLLPPKVKIISYIGKYDPSIGIIRAETKLQIRDGLSTPLDRIYASINLEKCNLGICKFKPGIKTVLGGHGYSQYLNVTIWYYIQRPYFAGERIVNMSFIITITDPGGHRVTITNHVSVLVSTNTTSTTAHLTRKTVSGNNTSVPSNTLTISGEKGSLEGNSIVFKWLMNNIFILIAALFAIIVLIVEHRRRE